MFSQVLIIDKKSFCGNNKLSEYKKIPYWFKILNNDHHAQYYIDHGFGEMIIPALQRLVKEGTTFCTWTHEGLPVNEVKMKKIEALLEKYQKLQDAAQK